MSRVIWRCGRNFSMANRQGSEMDLNDGPDSVLTF